jgi:hypothetical protein
MRTFIAAATTLIGGALTLFLVVVEGGGAALAGEKPDAGGYWQSDAIGDLSGVAPEPISAASDRDPKAKPIVEPAEPEIGSEEPNPAATLPTWIPRGARPITKSSDPLPTGTVANPLLLAADLAELAKTCADTATAVADTGVKRDLWAADNPDSAAAMATWAAESDVTLGALGDQVADDRESFLAEAEQFGLDVARAQASTGLASEQITDWLVLAADHSRAQLALQACKQAQLVAESEVQQTIAANSRAIDAGQAIDSSGIIASSGGPMVMALTSSCTSKPAAVDGQIAGFVPALSFSVSAGQAVEVSTSNLTQAGAPWGSSTPDTVVYLLKCTPGDCTQGSVIAINDDGNSATTASGTFPWDNLDSRIQIANGILSAGT